MVASTTEIANLALGHLGHSKPIGNLDTEQSLAAQACRTFYPISLATSVSGIPWMFCKKFATMQLVTDFTVNAGTQILEWDYAYRYPSDCIQFIRIVSPRLNNDTRQSRIPYTIAADASGLLIYTDWPGSNSLITPQCEYQFMNMNVGVYPADFVIALSYLLAGYIAPMVTAGDPYQLGMKAMGMYKTAIAEAESLDLNEEQRPEEPQSEFIRARGNGDPSTSGIGWQATPDGFVVE